jgi:hypothetical protein
MFKGKINEALFGKCWQKVVDRHTILRTSFHIAGLKKPLQVVHREAQLPIEILDFRHMDEDGEMEEIQRLMEQDRMKDYDLTKPPLMRMALIYGKDNNFKFWWRYHHMLMDGWAFNVVLRDFFDLYESYYLHDKEPQLNPPLAFRDYIAYRKSRNTVQEEGYWRKFLQGFKPLEAIAIGAGPTEQPTSVRQGRIELDLSDLYEPVRKTAKAHEVTMNAIFHGIFALHVSRHCQGQLDVVTGSTAADRPTQLKDSQSGVGLYVNTLPIRTLVEPDMAFIDWIKTFQPIFLECFQYAASSEHDIKRWCALPKDKMIFETNFVFENMPTAKGQVLNMDFEVTGYSLESRTHYPLNFYVWPDIDMEIKIIYDKKRFSAQSGHMFLHSIRDSLERLTNNPTVKVKQILL